MCNYYFKLYYYFTIKKLEYVSFHILFHSLGSEVCVYIVVTKKKLRLDGRLFLSNRICVLPLQKSVLVIVNKKITRIDHVIQKGRVHMWPCVR